MEIIKILATGFYVGKIPVAPGTFGTLLAFPVAFLFFQLGPVAYLMATVILTGVSILVAQVYENQLETHDSKEIVIDEIVGGVIALTWVTTWQGALLAFVLFRFFDILKPFPISWADRKIPGGMGVVADDVIAGIITNVILQVLMVKTAWIGGPITL